MLASVDHKHVNGLVRVEHMCCTIATDDGTEALSVELGVEHRAGEILKGAVFEALGVGQVVAKVAVVLGVVWQIVEDEMADAAQLVAFVEVKAFGEEEEVHLAVVEQVARSVDALVVAVLGDVHRVDVVLLEVVAYAHEVEVGRDEYERVRHHLVTKTRQYLYKCRQYNGM